MENDAIKATAEPVTVRSLTQDLARLGVPRGATVIVHSAMSRLGWVAGGAHAVALALLEAIGPDGTLVMPAHTGLSDPRYWQHPPVPEAWWQIIRDETPAYDPPVTPTRGMGAVVECFRTVPGTRRSAHPMFSFVAHGPAAEDVLADHRLDDALGETSPLGHLYRLDAWVLLLGVDHAHNTSLHLAEHRAAYTKPYIEHGAPVLVDGRRQWVVFRDLDSNSDDFAELGEDMARDTSAERHGPAGAGTARLARVRDVVDYGVGWLGQHRS